MLIALALLWVTVIVLGLAVVALTRQIGLLHERLAPIGALALQSPLAPGDVAPRVRASALSGDPLLVGGARREGEMQLLMFVSPTCPICKTLLPTVKSFADAEALDLTLIGDGDVEEHHRMAQRFDIPLSRFAVSTEVGRAYGVGKLPHAVLIGDSGQVISQGLVNTREHLESLLVAHETGLRSVQQYLENRKRIQHV
jgi:methylamine dehydrogenase accessory protein MauD